MAKYKKKRRAFVFTLYFPFTHKNVSYDRYISTEIKKLALAFETVDVISFSSGHDGQRDTPGNVRVWNFHVKLSLLDKISSWLVFFNGYFIKEIINLMKVYRRFPDFGLMKAIIVYGVKTARHKSKLENFFKNIDFNEYDVVVYSYWHFEYALAATLLKNKYPFKMIIRNHSLDLYFERMPENYQPFKRFAYLKSDLFVFISAQGLNYFMEKHRIPDELRGKALVNRVAIENPSLPYNKTTEKIILLSNAWIQPLKRVDLIIRALGLINDIPIDWTHIGDDYGTDRMGEIHLLLEKHLDGKKNIQYDFVGRKNIKEIFGIYQSRKINLFINVSTTEGIPVSMMEALSFGVPVIGTRVGGVAEIVEDRVNGFLLPPDVTEQQVADKITEYFRLPDDKKKELSDNARRIWVEKFYAEKNAGLLINKILSLIPAD